MVERTVGGGRGRRRASRVDLRDADRDADTWTVSASARTRSSIRFSATTAALPAKTTTNSSPPYLPTKSTSRTLARSRRPEPLQGPVAGQVPVRVVDALEAVEVQETHDVLGARLREPRVGLARDQASPVSASVRARTACRW